MNIQWRRRAKSIVRSVPKRCRPDGWLAVLMAALLMLGPSCASLTRNQVAALTAIAMTAAEIGAHDWLVKHPEHKASFDLVVKSLMDLAPGGFTNEVKAAALLSSLPTPSLVDPKMGALYVTEPNLVVWDESRKKAFEVEGAATAPVIKATLIGLRRATGPQPPMPGVAKAGAFKVD